MLVLISSMSPCHETNLPLLPLETNLGPANLSCCRLFALKYDVRSAVKIHKDPFYQKWNVNLLCLYFLSKFLQMNIFSFIATWTTKISNGHATIINRSCWKKHMETLTYEGKKIIISFHWSCLHIELFKGEKGSYIIPPLIGIIHILIISQRLTLPCQIHTMFNS